MSAIPPPRAQARWRGLLAVLGLLCLCAAAGFMAHRLFVHGPAVYPAPHGAGPQGTDGAPEPAADALAPAPPKVADKLPDISLPGLDGKTHRLTEWKGRPLVINFWATWCEPCRREIPLLTKLRREYASKNLEIVGIAIDQQDPVREYASAHGMDYPLLLGEREGLEAARAFGMETVLPFSVFIDRSGDVVTLKVGELHPAEARLIMERIVDLDAGRLSLAAAREAIGSGTRSLRGAHAPD